MHEHKHHSLASPLATDYSESNYGTIHFVPQEDHRHLYLRTARARLHNSQTCLLATFSYC